MAAKTTVMSECYIFLYGIVFAATITTIPQLIVSQLCASTYNDTVCDNLSDNRFHAIRDDIFGTAALWNLGVLASQLVPSLLTILIWGPLADKIGRSTAMIVPPLLGAVQSCVYFLCALAHGHVAYLFLGSWISSLYAEMQGVVMLSYGYMASATKHEDRTLRMIILESSVFIGAIPGAIGAGYCIQYLGFAAVFIATFVIHVLNILFVVFILPKQQGIQQREIQSVKTEQEEMFTDERSNDGPVDNSDMSPPSFDLRNTFSHIIDIVWRRNEDRATLLPLLVCFCLLLMVVVGDLDISVLYAKNAPFSLSPSSYSLYFAATCLIRACGMVLISQIAVRFFHVSDYILAIIGAASQLAYCILTAVASTTTMLFLVSLTGFAFPQSLPAVRSLASKFFHEDNQCTAVAVFEFVDVVAAILAGLSVSSIYNKTVSLYAGSVYLILAFFSLMALLIFLYLTRIEGTPTKPDIDEEECHLLSSQTNDSSR